MGNASILQGAAIGGTLVSSLERKSTNTMLSYIATLGSALSLFTVWDLLSEKPFLHKISWYLFGYEEIRFRAFCSTILKFLLSGFVKNGRIQKTRILLLSGFLYLLMLHEETYRTAQLVTDSTLVSILAFLLLVFLGALVSFPIDMAQIALARKLFYKGELTGRAFFFRLAAYVAACIALVGPLLFVSISVWVLGLYLVTMIESFEPFCREFASWEEYLSAGLGDEDSWGSLACFAHLEGYADQVMSKSWRIDAFGWLINSLIISTTSIIYIAALLSVVMIIGSTLHFSPSLFRGLNLISQNSNVHDYPFTVIGVIAIFLFEILRALVFNFPT